MIGAARVEGARRFLHSESITAFVDGAEWYAAGMAVCAFLEDLAALLDMESPAPQVCQCCGQNMLCTSCGVG